MVDVQGLSDVPPQVLDLLRIFLDASSRGEQAVLVLETRNSTLTTKFRTVETLTGAPATTRTRKKNPARARRSQLRLEKFQKKKEEEKKANEDHQAEIDNQVCSHAAGDTSSKNKLVVNLARKDNHDDGGFV